MVTVEIDKQFQEEVDKEVLLELVGEVFEYQKISSIAGLSIRVSDNATLQQINAKYLGIEAPTDVLSFPVEFEDPESGGHYYGDIILSYEKAATQAESGGHATLDEIKLLVVHGILHLLGFDHANEKEKQEMWSAQDRLLAALDIKARPTE
jgi:probable rRNA maturation factor